MQTRTYGDLFKLIQSLAGVGSFATSEKADIANLINRRFSEAFNTSPIWPRYLVPSEKRNLVSLVLTGASGAVGTAPDGAVVNQNYVLLGTGKGTGAEKAGTLVYSGLTNSVIIYNDKTANKWYIDIGASATQQSDGTYVVTGDTPPEFTEGDVVKKDNVSDVEIWTRASGSGNSPTVTDKQLIPYAQSGLNSIGDFIRVHRKRSFLNDSSIEYDFYVDVDGANILNITSTTDSTAFATYKKQFTPFSVTSDYENSTVEVPAEFFHYIAHAAYADFLRMDGQVDKALVEEQTAGNYLALELEKIDLRSNNNSINKRFSTYVNRQSR